MRKIWILAAFMCLPVTAQAAEGPEASAGPAYEAFDGVFFGANAGGSVNISEGHANYDYVNLFGGGLDVQDRRTADYDVSDKSDFVHSLELGYSHAVTGRFLIGVTGSYFFETTREIRTDGYVFSNPNGRGDYPLDYSVLTRIDPRSHLSVGLEPGYLVSEKALVFFSAAYHYMNANLRSTSDLGTSNMNDASTVITDASNRRSFHGIGLGGGVKYNIFKHCLLKLSAEWILFGRESADLPSFRSPADEITFSQNGKVQPSWVNMMAGITYTFG